MPKFDRFETAWHHLYKDAMRNVDTFKPCVVTKVNGSTLNAKPLTTTKYVSRRHEEQPEVFDVPFFIFSGKKGDAAITVPVAVGDNVVIAFSDRDIGDLRSTDGQTPQLSHEVATHKYFPLFAFPGYFTTPNEIPVNSNNIVINNGNNSIEIPSSGNIVVKGNIQCDDILVGPSQLSFLNHTHATAPDGSAVGPSPLS